MSSWQKKLGFIGNKERGFSLIELSIVLVIIGVLSMASLQVFNAVNNYRNQTLANKALLQAQQALVFFAQGNFRLPCPDINGDGYEDCAGGYKTGQLPFYTVGLPVSSQVADVDVGFQNLIYGVFRDAANDAELTVLAERTGDSLGDADYQNMDDFKKALSNASLLAVTNNQPFITGDNHSSGSEDCSTNQVANGAFWLASSSFEDADGNGNFFDGVNASLKHDGSGSLCFAAPSRRQDANYVDRVSGLAFSELIGLL
ncbi:MAG: type II secretion system protein [Thiomicrorhabdus sp.]|nr:type II secretion system protein [Thiomicrorhabdus sp.]